MAARSSDNPLTSLRLFAAAQTPPDVPDRELLDRFLGRKDEAAFAALVHRHGGMVLGACRRVLGNPHDAEDACQATFLILAHKAAGIRKRDALGSWLHGVAVRVARDLRAKLARRTAQPLAAADAVARPDRPEALTWDEVRKALDEELRRLPEHYRAALVLCYLEGRSRDEAAHQLGWSLATLRGRLERGRALLHARLVRRGLTLSAALVAGAVVSDGARGAVPARLLLQIHRSAAGLAAGGTAGASPQVAALVNGALPAMNRLKKKSVFALALVALLGIGGYVAYRFSRAEAPPQAWATALTPGELQAEETVELSGRVLDPDGRPVAGAELSIVTFWDSPLNDGPPRARSGPDGRFTLAAPKSELARHLAAARPVDVVAIAKGFGMAWRPAADFLSNEERAKVGPLSFEQLLSAASKNATVLKLVRDDTPLTGRIETPDGQPIAGATVRLEGVYANAANDLVAWRAAAERKEDFNAAVQYLPLQLGGAGLERVAATTDRSGHFELTGIGANRVVSLRLGGPGLAAATVVARTQPGQRLEMNLNGWFAPEPHGCFGADFTVSAAPARPVVGVVRDIDTGRPVPGAVVQSYRFAGHELRGVASLHTRADAQGRYRLDGMPAGKGNMLLARGSGDLPYLAAVAEVDTSTGDGPAELDLKLKRGLWAEGRVTDADTGRPLSAGVDYYCLRESNRRGDVPGFDGAILGVTGYHTDAAGRFRVPALPGPGVVAATLHGERTFAAFTKRASTWQAGKSYADYQGKFDGPDGINGGTSVSARPCLFSPISYNQLTVINPAEDAGSVTCDLPVHTDGSPLKPAERKEADR
jgi:RNA polymerase sigma factor (sigma-70 family)